MAEHDRATLIQRIKELEMELEGYRRAGQFLEASEANLQLFARSLAHDFNNLLGAILGHASLLESISRPGEEVHEAAIVIRKAAERAGQLNAQLLHFTRGEMGRRIEVDVHETVREVTELLRRTIDPEIKLVTRLNAPECLILGDPGQIHQMFMNLVLNARDAMDGQGVLTVESSHRDAPAMLVVTVQDTGCGITPDVCARIFDPFFTTKKDRHNSGMGLAIVQRVVHSHGGSIQVETVPGQGTSFHVGLPMTDRGEPAAQD